MTAALLASNRRARCRPARAGRQPPERSERGRERSSRDNSKRSLSYPLLLAAMHSRSIPPNSVQRVRRQRANTAIRRSPLCAAVQVRRQFPPCMKH